MMKLAANGKSASQMADALVALYGHSFGGKPNGRYRISRKFLRQLAGRRKLADDFVHEIANDLFERGCVLIDLETHYAVLEQKLFNSYRRVTALAAAEVPGIVARQAGGTSMMASNDDG